MEKRIVGILTVFALLLSALPVQAAPAREMQALEMTVEDGMRTLAAIVACAIPEELFGDGVNGAEQVILAADHAPYPDLTAQALWAAALLARQTEQLSLEEARTLYSQIFTSGEFDLTPETESPFLTVTDAGIKIHDVSSLNCGGTHIYSVEFDGTDVLVKCDLYFCEGADPLMDDVETLPEETVAWTNSLTMSLRCAPETEFGYTLNSAVLSPSYQAGELALWKEEENTEYEYSLQVPSCLGLADDDPANKAWQSADGTATLTIAAREKTASGTGPQQAYDDLVKRNREENLGLSVVLDPDFCRVYAVGEGIFLMRVASENLTWDYDVTLTFPVERQDEYELYAEFIRNSLIMWGISNG